MKEWLGILVAVFCVSSAHLRAEPLDDEEAPEPAYHLTSRESRMAFGVIGGVTTVPGGNGLALNGQSSRYNFMLALQPDFRGKYFGLEMEGFYTGASFTSGYAQTDYRYLGGTVAGKIQYPVELRSFRFTPKAGIGYGYFSQTDEQGGVSMAAAGSQVSATMNTNGAFALLGAELEFVHRVILWADYAFSFYARSSMSFGGAASGLTSSLPYASYDARFDRFRAGLWIRVLPKFLLGGQYIRRGIDMGSGGAGFAGSLPLIYTPQNQFGLGALFQF